MLAQAWRVGVKPSRVGARLTRFLLVRFLLVPVSPVLCVRLPCVCVVCVCVCGGGAQGQHSPDDAFQHCDCPVSPPSRAPHYRLLTLCPAAY